MRNEHLLFTYMNQKIRTPFVISAAAGTLILIYHAIYQFDFISLDDGPHLYNNALMIHPTLSTLLEFWRKPYFGLYVPFTYSTWWFVSNLSLHFTGRIHPGFFHSLNLLMHGINGILAFLLLKELLSEFGSGVHKVTKKNSDKAQIAREENIGISATVGMLLFLMHPVQVETVCWVSCLKDLQSTFFLFLSLIFYCRTVTAKSTAKSLAASYPIQYGMAGLMFLCGVLSKPTLVIIPFLWLGIEFFCLGSLARSVRKVWPWLGIALVITLITKSQQPDARILLIGSIPERLGIAGYALGHYLLQILAPLNLSMEYPLPVEKVVQSSWFSFAWIIPCLGGIGLRWTPRWFKLGAFFVFLGLLPILGFIPFEFQNFSIVSDHYLYFPIFGFAFIFSHWVRIGLERQGKLSTLKWLLPFLVMVPYSSHQSRFWKDSPTLFARNMEENPEGYLSNFFLGNHYIEREEPRLALPYYLRAYRSLPRSIPAQQSIGTTYIRLGQYSEAIAHYERIFALHQVGNDMWSHQAYAQVRNDFAAALSGAGRTAEAIEQLKLALTLDPNLSTARENLKKLGQ
mgnify:CR=1 FL=1